MTEEMPKKYVCQNCGADIAFKPGSNNLVCPYCETENEISIETTPIEELDFQKHLSDLSKQAPTQDKIAVDCGMCGAQITLEQNITADECPFCGSKIVAQNKSIKTIKPQSVLPFKIDKNEAASQFRNWLQKIWFAPNALKKFARMDGLNGMYCPYWTYDCHTHAKYRGKRGEYYYENREVTTTENGEAKTRSEQVRRTRWYDAHGVIHKNFDDVLVLASQSLPENITDQLEPWDLENLVNYTDDYLSGFRVESYTVNLETGFVKAQHKMEPKINSAIHHDIGGDEQQILSKTIQYENITFKHILLPIWISAYNYKGKVYRFLVNARTGEVQAERPWSWIKIGAAVAVVLTIIFIIGFFYTSKG